MLGEDETSQRSVLSTWVLAIPGNDRWREDIHFAVRDENYRLIAYGNGDRELYDHRSDPWEWRNIAGDKANRDVTKRLAERLPDNPTRPEYVSGRHATNDASG